jgi:hypothetical protein
VRRLPPSCILTLDPGPTEDMFSPFAARAVVRGFEVQEMEAVHTPNFSAVPEPVERLLAIE